MEFIPAIDIISGKCVRLTQGDYSQKKEYNASPLEMAKQYEDVGVKRLHLVDLDGAKAKSVVNLKVLEEIANATQLSVDFSGGISSDQKVKDCFNAGAEFIAVGSVAVKQPELLEQWILAFGGDKILLAADCNNKIIATHGWQEASNIELLPFLNSWVKKGLKQGFVTDISKDGMLQGPAFELYQEIRETEPNFQLVASGGIRHMEDCEKLSALGLSGAIVGKAIYENHISFKEIEAYQVKYAV